jgi:signal transduction histidine kinase
MAIDWIGKLRRALQTLAFCLVIASLQWAVDPEQPYEVLLVHSVLIGTVIWAWVDFGVHLFPSAREHGWPAPLPALLLVASGIAAGFVIGHLAADAWYGRSTFSAPAGRLRAGLVTTAVAGVVACYWFYSQVRGEWLERERAQAARRADEARLKLLESQLEPHMLFNTLANLRALIAVDPPRAQAMLDRLIAFLRATLNASRTPLHPLHAEFERLADYLALMAVRMGPRLQVRLDLPDELREQPVPPLLLQPLVENSIKHGLEPQVRGGRIEVSARRDGTMLVLDVRDSGAGPVDQADGSRFGLAQVRERLAAQYGADAALRLDAASPGGGTLARITLPLQHPHPSTAPQAGDGAKREGVLP